MENTAFHSVVLVPLKEQGTQAVRSVGQLPHKGECQVHAQRASCLGSPRETELVTVIPATESECFPKLNRASEIASPWQYMLLPGGQEARTLAGEGHDHIQVGFV